ncbi:thiamine monophosphate kinase [Salmonella enterica subsp. enterica]|nr:thiamine monophosphate kinase [Salmonella enterica subsp. enterica]
MARWMSRLVIWGVPFTCIGQMTADIEGIAFVRDGEPVTFDWKGYDHFATP